MVSVNDDNYDYHVRDLLGYPSTGTCLVKYDPEVWDMLEQCKDAFTLIEKSQDKKLTQAERENLQYNWEYNDWFDQ